ncbi:hypothetical protein [Deinococcus sp. Leaf326]|uniref:DoxX family protein n=1 Tax=Deinococcus sp. Leaf326 TaxID=1736338 RepID=UPI0006F9FC5D|nr:hypothetical protein [Deinococcus sp. Leaf326]KQR08719.1 hypothetical protein ASF71_09305 [Deinococcus sp. Leaf326]
MTLPDASPTTPAQNAARILLGSALIFAGAGHLSFARADFQAQVPDLLPVDKDQIVLASGVAEIALGAALIGVPARYRRTVGAVAAGFFVAVFPGNISQYLDRETAFGLDTDTKRLVRLAGQPLLVAWAMWATGLIGARRNR